MERPAKFYKYHSIKDLHSITNLNDSIIYFSHPEDFNDPHDCFGRLMVAFPKKFDIGDEEYKKISHEVKKKLGVEETSMIVQKKKLS